MPDTPKRRPSSHVSRADDLRTNRRFKRAGFRYQYTSAGAVENYAQAARLRSTIGKTPDYHYERDVENFFRHSPAVVRRD